MVIIGNSMFLSDGEIRKRDFNLDLFLNAVNWLTGEETLLSITAKKWELRTLNLDRTQLNGIIAWSCLAFPVAILVAGIVVWSRRR